MKNIFKNLRIWGVLGVMFCSNLAVAMNGITITRIQKNCNSPDTIISSSAILRAGEIFKVSYSYTNSSTANHQLSVILVLGTTDAFTITTDNTGGTLTPINVTIANPTISGSICVKIPCAVPYNATTLPQYKIKIVATPISPISPGTTLNNIFSTGTAPLGVLFKINGYPQPIITASQSFCGSSGNTNITNLRTNGLFTWLGATFKWQNYPTTSNQWSDAPNTNNDTIYNITTNGLYRVVVNINSCQYKLDSATYILNPIPTINSVTPASRCGAGTVNLQASAIPNTASINWYSSATSSSILVTASSYSTGSISQTTTYFVDATLNGCTTSSRTQVIATINPNPTAYAGSNATICSGVTIPVGATATNNYTYLWNPTAGLSSSTASNPTLTPTNTGTTDISTIYTVTASLNGCTATNAITVIVKPLPTVSIAPAYTTICSGGNVLLSATSGLSSYLWNTPTTPSTAASVTVSPTNTTTSTAYSVIGTGSNGCTKSANAPVITVVDDPSVTPTSTAANTIITQCVGASQTISVTGSGGGSGVNLTYRWKVSTSSGGSLSDVPTNIVGFDSNTLTLPSSSTVTQYYKCLVSTNASTTTLNCGTALSGEFTVITNPVPTLVNAGSDINYCQGTSAITLTPNGGTGVSNSSYVWTQNTTVIANNNNTNTITVTPTTTTVYSVTVTNPGCAATQSDNVQITFYPTPTLIQLASIDTCSGNVVNFNLSGTNASQYTWTSTGSSAIGINSTGTIQNNVPFNYTVTNTSATVNLTQTITFKPEKVVNANLTCLGVTKTMSITVHKLPTANAGSDNTATACSGSVSNLGGNVASPTASGTTIGNYTYSWSPTTNFGANQSTTANPMVTGLINTTTYTVLVTDGNGCTDSDSKTVNTTAVIIPISLTGNTSSDTVWCENNNTSKTFNASIGAGTNNGVAPYKYFWTGQSSFNNGSSTTSNPTLSVSQTNPSFLNTSTANSSTNYQFTCTITDANGCAVTKHKTIKVNRRAIVIAGSDIVICQGSQINLAGTITNYPNISGTWTAPFNSNLTTAISTPNSFTSLFIPPNSLYTTTNALQDSTIILRLTSSDPDGLGPSGPCPVVTDSVHITINRRAYASITTLPSTICQGSSIDLNGVISGGILGTYNGSWSSSKAVSSFSSTSNVSSTTYSPNGAIGSEITNFGINTIKLISADLDGGGPCLQDTATLIITVDKRAIIDGISFENTYQLCAGDTIELNGFISNGASSASWSAVNGNGNVIGAGGYQNQEYASIEFANNSNTFSKIDSLKLSTDDPVGICPSVSKSMPITIYTLPETPTITGISNVCSNTSYQFFGVTSATNNVNFRWRATNANIYAGNFMPHTLINFPNSGTANLSATAIIPHDAALIAKGGCFNSSSKNVIVGNNISPDISVIFNSSFGKLICQNSDEGAIYQWGNDVFTNSNISTSLIPNATNQDYTPPSNTISGNIFTPPSNTYYWVQTITGTGTDTCRQKTYVIGNEPPSVTALNTLNNSAAFSLYPNPATSSFQISKPNNVGNCQLQIVDLLGNIVYTKNNILQNETINTNSLGNGLYMVLLNSNNSKVYTQKLIKQ